MKVVICFPRPSDSALDTLRGVWYGKYISGYFVFVDESDIKMFISHVGLGIVGYMKTQRPTSKQTDQLNDFLLLAVDEEETRRLLASCEACVKSKKGFNLYDILAVHVPFREPEEISIYNASSIHDTQAVILILRECLNQENKLRHGLEGLHSRLTVAETLYERLRPYTLPVFWVDMVELVKWSDKESKTVRESKPSPSETH